MNVLRYETPDDESKIDLSFLDTTDIPLPIEFAPAQFISNYFKEK